MMTPCIVKMSGWAGIRELKAEVIGETPMRYRVKLLETGRWPGRMRFVEVGSIKLVPKHAVRIRT